MQSKTRIKKFIPLVISGIILFFGRFTIELFSGVPNSTFQGIISLVLKLNSILINTFHLGTSSVSNNVIQLNGDHGPFGLQLFLPSFGIQFVITYVAIISVILISIDISRKRKIMYFTIGVIGTLAVLVIRILVLSLFVLKVSTSVDAFQTFHGMAEFMTFLPWVVIYLIVIYKVESSRKQKRQFQA